MIEKHLIDPRGLQAGDFSASSVFRGLGVGMGSVGADAQECAGLTW